MKRSVTGTQVVFTTPLLLLDDFCLSVVLVFPVLRGVACEDLCRVESDAAATAQSTVTTAGSVKRPSAYCGTVKAQGSR